MLSWCAYHAHLSEWQQGLVICTLGMEWKFWVFFCKATGFQPMHLHFVVPHKTYLVVSPRSLLGKLKLVPLCFWCWRTAWRNRACLTTDHLANSWQRRASVVRASWFITVSHSDQRQHPQTQEINTVSLFISHGTSLSPVWWVPRIPSMDNGLEFCI